MADASLIKQLRNAGEEEPQGTVPLSIVAAEISEPDPPRPQNKSMGLVSQFRGAGDTPQRGFVESADRVVESFNKGVEDVLLPAAKFFIENSHLNPFHVAPPRKFDVEANRLTDIEPEGKFERGAEVAGQTLPLLFPTSFSLAAIPGRVGITLLAKAQNFLRSVGQSTLKSPGMSIAVEGTSAFSAGFGGELAVEAFPDSKAARFVGEFTSGMATPALLPMNLLIRGGRFVRSKIAAGKVRGSQKGQERILRTLGHTPVEDATRAMDRGALDHGGDIPTTLDPETGKPVLSDATRTGLPGPMALEEVVMRSSDELAAESDQVLERANTVIQQSFREAASPGINKGGGTPEDAREYFLALFDARLQAAAIKIEKRVRKLGNKGDLEAVNRVFDQELLHVTRVINDQEEELFLALPEDALVSTTSAKEALQEEIRKVGGLDGPGELVIPKHALKFLQTIGPDGKINKSAFGEVTSLKKMRILQSNLRADARRHRKEGNPRMGRVEDKIATAIYNDLLRMQGTRAVREHLQVAVGFSKQANDVLGKFTLGRLGGRSTTPTNRPVESSLVASQSIGLAGQHGKNAYNQMLNALRLAEEGAENVRVLGRQTAEGDFNAPSVEFTRDAARQYFRAKFLSEAVAGEEVVPSAARSFMEKHQQTLDVIPGIRNELEAAMNSQARLDALRKTPSRFNGGAKIAKVAMLIQEDPAQRFRRLVKMDRKTAEREVKLLNRLAKTDSTGIVQEGLRAAWVDFLLGAGKEGRSEIPFVSANAIQNIRKTESAKAIERVLFPSNKDKQKIRRIVHDLQLLEQRRRTKQSIEGVLGEQPNEVSQAVLGLIGAGGGRHLSKATGAGGDVQTPNILAKTFKKLENLGILNPAKRFIIDALSKEGLFRDVLMQKVKPDGDLPKKARQKLNAWVASVLFEHGTSTRPSDREEQQEQEENPLRQPLGLRPEGPLQAPPRPIPATQGTPFLPLAGGAGSRRDRNRRPQFESGFGSSE